MLRISGVYYVRDMISVSYLYVALTQHAGRGFRTNHLKSQGSVLQQYEQYRIRIGEQQQYYSVI